MIRVIFEARQGSQKLLAFCPSHLANFDIQSTLIKHQILQKITTELMRLANEKPSLEHHLQAATTLKKKNSDISIYYLVESFDIDTFFNSTLCMSGNCFY